MNTLKKVIVILGNVLNFIGKVPAFLLPSSLKGYRTELFNILAVAVVALEQFDITGLADAICGLINCDADAIKGIYVLLIAAINISLRRKTDTAPHTNWYSFFMGWFCFAGGGSPAFKDFTEAHQSRNYPTSGGLKSSIF